MIQYCIYNPMAGEINRFVVYRVLIIYICQVVSSPFIVGQLPYTIDQFWKTTLVVGLRPAGNRLILYNLLKYIYIYFSHQDSFFGGLSSTK